MNPDQIRMIRHTFGLVAGRPEIAASAFYQRLFELDPSLRLLFRSDLEEQGRKLMQMLAAAVGLLDRPESLLPALENLGRRHTNYGVRDEHYDTVGAALLWTLSESLGDLFSATAHEAWASLYNLVAATMKRAANEENCVALAADTHRAETGWAKA